MKKKAPPSSETLRLQVMAQAFLEATLRTQRISGTHSRLSGGEIVREAQYWEELLCLGANPNITLNQSIDQRNNLHLGGLACLFEPLFQVYQKHNGPLDFIEENTSHEYITLPKKVVGKWRTAKRDRQKMMDKHGEYTLPADDWAFDKIMLLKNHRITTTLTGLKGDTILDDVLTHEFLLNHNNGVKSDGELVRRLLEQGFWFNPTEEKELYKGGVSKRLPHIYNIIEGFVEKKALKDALAPLQDEKPFILPKKM